jgi:NADH-quinone oxidoreductase subunit J
MLSIIMLSLIFLSFIVVFSKDTIKSMLCLILSFILTAIIFLLLGSEFISLILVIVYAGAISILFIFVIMLLNLRLTDIYYINYYYIPLCLFIGLSIFLITYLFFIDHYSFFYYNNLILNNDVSYI